MMIPIQRTPLISFRTNLCQDEYWRETAAMPSTGVILNLQEQTWLPCIQLVSALETFELFSSMVFGVDIAALDGIISAHYVQAISGGLFVSDQQ